MAETNTYSLGKAWNVISNCAAVTGITASGPALIKSIEVPPNNFGVGDIVQIEACFSKQGSSGKYFTELYWNTSATLTNARLICHGTLNPTYDGDYAPASFTYSNIFRRVQIVSLTNSTRSFDPYNTFNSSTFSRGTDLFFRDRVSGTVDDQYQIIGTQESLGSIDWTHYNQIALNGGFIIAAGGVENSNDRLRCEWIKISNLTTGNFTVPAPPR
jgi:hypothetical protein